MAHYLHRAFSDNPETHVFHGLRRRDMPCREFREACRPLTQTGYRERLLTREPRMSHAKENVENRGSRRPIALLMATALNRPRKQSNSIPWRS